MSEQNLDPRALARELSGFHLIDGQLVPASAGKTFEVRSPATREVIGQAADGDAADVERAVRSAAAAQAAWAKLPARERGKRVQACARVLEAHVEELGRLIALETGKALRTESRVEAGVVADVFSFFGGLGGELKGETVPFKPDVLTFTIRQPVGVVAAVLPWNVPLLLMALKVAPALVAGNAVVVKSAEESPLCVLRCVQLLQSCLPPGVLNLLSGDGPGCGAPLCNHPVVGKISFTGSVPVGRIIAHAAADKLVPVTLELGGKSPMIVMADADMDKVIDGAITSMRFTRQGQSCTAASRMLVQRPIVDEYVRRLKARVDQLVMGDPLDEKTDIGTIISPQQFATVQRYVAIGEATPGATAHRCSALPTDPRLKDGLYAQPVIFTGLGPDSQVVREEIFGPVTAVIPFDTYEEALAIANGTEYGLAATIWTRDLRVAMDAVHRLEAGFVQVNQNVVVQSMLSYGGIKQSGLGKEASLDAMLHHFTHEKTVLINFA
jgi:acyl-CoA reductase-like NAD-dependent aldehyde dehydrogenase